MLHNKILIAFSTNVPNVSQQDIFSMLVNCVTKGIAIQYVNKTKLKIIITEYVHNNK